jgi:urease accessory protein
MLIANRLIPAGRGLAGALVRRAATVELDWDVRQKSRFDATDSQGRALGVFLPRGSVVRGGDVLVAEDGSLVRVLAAPQPVLVVHHCSQHGTPFDLRAATPGQPPCAAGSEADHLKLENRPCWPTCCATCTWIVSEDVSAFEAETGAYAAAGRGHGHAHGHGHDEHQRSGTSTVTGPHATMTMGLVTVTAIRTTTSTDGPVSCRGARPRRALIELMPGLAGAAGGRLQLASTGGRGRLRPRRRSRPGARLAARPAAPGPGAQRPAVVARVHAWRRGDLETIRELNDWCWPRARRASCRCSRQMGRSLLEWMRQRDGAPDALADAAALSPRPPGRWLSRWPPPTAARHGAALIAFAVAGPRTWCRPPSRRCRWARAAASGCSMR